MLENFPKYFNVRKIPHPERRNYSGASFRCKINDVKQIGGLCPAPVDAIDRAALLHDQDTKNSADIFADWKLVGRWLKINPFNKSNYDFDVPVTFLNEDYKIDPRVYQYSASAVMFLVGCVAIPVRAVKKFWGGFLIFYTFSFTDFAIYFSCS